MAQLLSIATGNASSASTWGLVNSTSFVSSTETATALTTSRVGATTFTPGAITVKGIAVKLAVRTGTTGTMTVDLDQGGSLVTGTDVTINVSDLPVAATADLNGGWHYFEFASPVTLAAATAYSVKCKTSSSSQVSLFATSSSNWCRCLVTTTTKAPAAGDDMIVCGKYTGAGASTSYTVTWDITATTDFGSTPTAANSLLAPGICVCNKGTLAIGMAASTNYNMKLSNSIIVYSGGIFNMGTVGSEMPRDSSFTLQFDCGANVNYGLTVRNLGTWTSQGLSRTSGKNIYYCKLNTDEAVNSTSLGVDTDTGWLDNDEIAISSTTRNNLDVENGTLNGNAGASSLTVDGFAGTGGGLAAAHSGTSPTQATIILLTRNVKLTGASATLQAYIRINPTATVDLDWTEFKWLGSNTANKKGIDIATLAGGSCNINYCVIRNFEVANSLGINVTSVSGNTITISNNVLYRCAVSHLVIGSTTGTQTYDSNVFIRTISGPSINTSDAGVIFTNNIINASASYGYYVSENAAFGTFEYNDISSCLSNGLYIANSLIQGIISNSVFWRNGAQGIYIASSQTDFKLDTLTLFGNSTANITLVASVGSCLFLNCVLSSDTTFLTATGFSISSTNGVCNAQFINCTFGVSSGILSAHSTDIGEPGINTLTQVKLINCLLSSATDIGQQQNFSNEGYISSQKHNQTSGIHKIWRRYGTISIETTTTQSGTTSMKMTPRDASNKLQSIGPYGGFKVAVASGQTCTPTVYVYEDGSYNGARARLIVLRNDALGITSDTVLDTATAASDAAWEALTGTTAAVTDAGTLEFIIDCDGTAGNLFVDTFSATVT